MQWEKFEEIKYIESIQHHPKLYKEKGYSGRDSFDLPSFAGYSADGGKVVEAMGIKSLNPASDESLSYLYSIRYVVEWN